MKNICKTWGLEQKNERGFGLTPLRFAAMMIIPLILLFVAPDTMVSLIYLCGINVIFLSLKIKKSLKINDNLIMHLSNGGEADPEGGGSPLFVI